MFFAFLPVVRLNTLSLRKLAQMLSLAYMLLDGVNFNIFLHNFKLALSRRRDILVSSLHVNNVLLGVDAISKGFYKFLRQWCYQWMKCGVLILLHVQASVAAAPSILSILDSTPKWGKLDKDTIACPCRQQYCEVGRTYL